MELEQLELGKSLEDVLKEVLAERREEELQPVYEDALAHYIEAYERGIEAKQAAWEALEVDRAAKVAELTKAQNR